MVHHPKKSFEYLSDSRGAGAYLDILSGQTDLASTFPEAMLQRIQGLKILRTGGGEAEHHYSPWVAPSHRCKTVLNIDGVKVCTLV
jgi:hypothetical protein